MTPFPKTAEVLRDLRGKTNCQECSNSASAAEERCVRHGNGFNTAEHARRQLDMLRRHANGHGPESLVAKIDAIRELLDSELRVHELLKKIDAPPPAKILPREFFHAYAGNGFALSTNIATKLRKINPGEEQQDAFGWARVFDLSCDSDQSGWFLFVDKNETAQIMRAHVGGLPMFCDFPKEVARKIMKRRAMSVSVAEKHETTNEIITRAHIGWASYVLWVAYQWEIASSLSDERGNELSEAAKIERMHWQ